MFDLSTIAAIGSAWGASLGAAYTEGGAVGAITLAFSGALTMLYVGQRRQRLMLLESIELARSDRDDCREELAAMKSWLVASNQKEERSLLD